MVCLVIFAVLEVVVTIGGFSDVRSLLKSIDKQHKEQNKKS